MYCILSILSIRYIEQILIFCDEIQIQTEHMLTRYYLMRALIIEELNEFQPQRLVSCLPYIFEA